MDTSHPTRRRAAALVLCLAAAGMAPALARDSATPPQVALSYSDPGAFTEARENPSESDRARQAWLDVLRRHAEQRAARQLAPGQRLDITVTDIRRAGRFEPWRGPSMDQVRIVRDVYPPRIALRFEWQGADGRLLKSGERTLSDPAFMMRASTRSDDPLRYEKTLLDDWLDRELRAAD